MANRRNSIKKIKADERKRVINKSASSEVRSVARKFTEACEAKDQTTAKNLSLNYFSMLDKALKKGLLKENSVNRTKSRAQKHLNLIQA